MAIKSGTEQRVERIKTMRSQLLQLSSGVSSSPVGNNSNAVVVCNECLPCCDDGVQFGEISPISTASVVSDTSSSSDEDVFRLHYHTLAEIQRHNTERSAWIIAGEDIYDVTEYVEYHPGGKYSIMKKIGGAVDCTRDLMFHSKSGQKYWKQFLVGKVTKFPSKNGLPVEKEWWKFWE